MGGRAPPAINGLVSLKVDNISYNTTQNDLRHLFDRYGEIGDVHIPRDKYTRQSKGFGFVRFHSKRDAEHALDRTDGKLIDGREIRVSIARYERPIDDRQRGSRRSRSRSPPRRSRSRSPPSRSRSRSRTRSRSPRRRSDSRSRSPRNDPKERSRSQSHSRSRSGSK